MTTNKSRIRRPLLILLGSVLLSLGATSVAGASRHASHWQKLLLTPAQAKTLQQGSGFHFYDRPAVRKVHLQVGDDQNCAKSQGAYLESIQGNLAGTEQPEDLSIEVDYFTTSAAAHREFRCLSDETYNFTHNGDFDLAGLGHHVGAESFGGGGDNNPIGVLRSGRYIVWIEILNGYGPIGDLMSAEAALIRQYG